MKKILILAVLMSVLISACVTTGYHWKIVLQDGSTVIEEFCDIYDRHVNCYDEPSPSIASPDRVYYNVVSMEKIQDDE